MVERNITNDAPALIATDVGKRFCTFIEIARRPDGLCVRDLMELFGESKASIWNHIKPLVECHYISGRKLIRNGRRAKYFKATPFGIDHMATELTSIAEMLVARRAEMVKERGIT